MKRPVWLEITEYRRLQAKYLEPGPSGDMQMRCVNHHPEGPVWLNSSNGVFDHIVPRANGGADVADNLQPMCVSCNAEKNRFADANWSRRLYFDAPLNTEALRASQNDFCYAKIMEFSEEFARPFSMINGHLLCLFQVVGAGKTLGKFVIPFALNQCKNAVERHAPRVERALILTKETSLRAQIAEELQIEPVKFGIVDEAPNVVEIKSKDMLSDPAILEKNQFFVCCPQMIWGEEDDPETKTRLLSPFGVILIDEMHYAKTRIGQIVKNHTPHALCFGFTASPIDRKGDLYPNMIRVSVFGYRNASMLDSSMKVMSERNPHNGRHNFDPFITELEMKDNMEIDSAIYPADEVRRLPQNRRKKLAESLDFSKSVADSVVFQVWSLDVQDVRHGLKSPRVDAADPTFDYRTSKMKVAHGEPYPAHAMIRVDGMQTAKDICAYLNAKFEADRTRYPKKKGWTAITTFTGSEEKLSDTNNAWFRARNQGGKVDAKCARFLVVVDMAKEGTNNKYACVLGQARSSESLTSDVQSIGRLIRSAHTVDDEGVVRIPPRDHDRVYIITHEIYQVRNQLAKAMEFIIHMDERCREIMDLDEYFGGENAFDPGNENDPGHCSFNFYDKVRVVEECGRIMRSGRTPSLRAICNTMGIHPNETKAQTIRRLLDYCIDENVAKIKKELRYISAEPTVYVDVTDDSEVYKTEMEKVEWTSGITPMDQFYDVWRDLATQDSEDEYAKKLKTALASYYDKEMEQSRGGALVMSRTLSDIRENLRQTLISHFSSRKYFRSSNPRVLVDSSLKAYFDTANLSDGGVFDTPKHHNGIDKDELKLLGYAIQRAMVKGDFDGVNFFLRYPLELLEDSV